MVVFHWSSPHVDVETVTLGGIGHLGLLLSPQVVGRIVAVLSAPG
jgi:hypothetical protein